MPYKDPEKQRAFQRAWMARRRQDWIAAQGPCAECGSTVGLEVDHVDPAEKLMSPRSIWSRKAADRATELAKCQVLCRECHAQKTSRMMSIVPRNARGHILPRETWGLIT